MMVGNPGAGFVDAMSSMQATATIIGYLLLYVPFPLLLLWLIGRPSAKNDLMPAS
jgi:hypothetical protein